MPQPALHMLLAGATLRHWRRQPCHAPFDAGSAEAANAFLVGSLGPDLGLFPGGAAEFSVIAHSGRSGELVRALYHHAATDAQRAFAWGWLGHVLADVAIHPLVNRAGAESAGSADTCSLFDHVRVEVGLDAWYGSRHAVLRRFRLAPALDHADLAFLSHAFRDTHGYHITPAQLARMQLGAVHFTHLALHFAAGAARELCWREAGRDATTPPFTALVWRIASALSVRGSVVHAYLNPARPTAWLRVGASRVIRGFNSEMDGWVRRGVALLPDYNLEDGSVPGATAPVVWLDRGPAEKVA